MSTDQFIAVCEWTEDPDGTIYGWWPIQPERSMVAAKRSLIMAASEVLTLAASDALGVGDQNDARRIANELGALL